MCQLLWAKSVATKESLLQSILEEFHYICKVHVENMCTYWYVLLMYHPYHRGNWRMMSSRSVGRRHAVSSRAERHLCVDLGGLLLPIEPRASSRQSRSLGLGGSFSSCWRLGRLRGLSDGFLVLLLISLSDGFLVLEQVKRHEIMWRGLRRRASRIRIQQSMAAQAETLPGKMQVHQFI